MAIFPVEAIVVVLTGSVLIFQMKIGLFVWVDVPVNNFSVMSQQFPVFLG